MCCIARERDTAKWPTLGIFKPHEIQRLRIVPEKVPTWTPDELSKLNQSLFRVVDGRVIPDGSTRAPLEKIPVSFVYDFRCDHEECKGHKMSTTDWEICQSYRDWRGRYGENGWESKFRQRWEEEILTKFDTHFYVGTMHGHPATWLIVGAFYPPLQPSQAALDQPSPPQQLKLLAD